MKGAKLLKVKISKEAAQFKITIEVLRILYKDQRLQLVCIKRNPIY
jgi:hypothetical protein